MEDLKLLLSMAVTRGVTLPDLEREELEVPMEAVEMLGSEELGGMLIRILSPYYLAEYVLYYLTCQRAIQCRDLVFVDGCVEFADERDDRSCTCLVRHILPWLNPQAHRCVVPWMSLHLSTLDILYNRY